MDPFQSRNGAFGEGASVSPSFQQAHDSLNSQVPRGYTPMGSPNGMSTNQYQSTLGGLLPVNNGSSAGQYTNTMGGRFQGSNGSASDTYSVKKYFGD